MRQIRRKPRNQNVILESLIRRNLRKRATERLPRILVFYFKAERNFPRVFFFIISFYTDQMPTVTQNKREKKIEKNKTLLYLTFAVDSNLQSY